MKNLYTDFNGLHVNEKNINFFMGLASGVQILENLNKTKSEVLIFTPILGESLINEVIKLHNSSIKVQLLFNDLPNDKYKLILKKLIHQSIETNIHLKKYKRKIQILLLCTILSFYCITIFFMLQIFSEVKLIFSFVLKRALVIFIFTVISFFIIKYWLKLNQLKIYTYEYYERIKFKYLKSIKNKSTKDIKLHTSMIIIDSEVAFIGSFNLTSTSLFNQVESLIKITDPLYIEELISYYESIYQDDRNFQKFDINYLGARVFGEE